MKQTIIWAVVVLFLGFAAVAEFRYAVIVNPPVVAKIDRLTGDVWIANAGKWIRIQEMNGASAEAPVAVIPAASTKK